MRYVIRKRGTYDLFFSNMPGPPFWDSFEKAEQWIKPFPRILPNSAVGEWIEPFPLILPDSAVGEWIETECARKELLEYVSLKNTLSEYEANLSTIAALRALELDLLEELRRHKVLLEEARSEFNQLPLIRQGFERRSKLVDRISYAIQGKYNEDYWSSDEDYRQLGKREEPEK